MFLLDTNIVSEMRRAASGKADENVVRWLAGVDANALFLSAMTLMEIELGILLIGRRDNQQGDRLRLWRDRYLLPEFSDRILPIDARVALRCAPLHVPDPCPERDALIAATALVHGMTVVTRNVADFERTGVGVLNPWLSRPSLRH